GATRDVYFVFNASAGTTYRVTVAVSTTAGVGGNVSSTCPVTTTSANTTTGPNFGCWFQAVAPAPIVFSPAAAGPVYVRVADFTTDTPQTGTVLVEIVTSGACCNNTTGVCTQTISTACSTTTSTYQGDNTVCTPSPCPPSGSCCNPTSGTCTITIQSLCASPNVWTSGVATCTPKPGPQPPPPPN
ncbi:MAG: hypothetical protein K2Q20_10420, partial [Phycisphaerales bacterium]|nr:hypothetical protein [Phycisphaerales bacterium]